MWGPLLVFVSMCLWAARANPLVTALGSLHPNRLRTRWIAMIAPRGIDNYQCFNPSVANLSGRIIVYLRCAPYGLLNPRGLVYHAYDPSFVRGGYSAFVVAELPAHRPWQHVYQNMLDIKEVYVDPSLYVTASDIQGLEDARLIAYDGAIWFTATVPDVNMSVPYMMARGPFMGRLSADLSSVDVGYKVVAPHAFKEPVKNILPFSYGGTIGLFDARVGRGYLMSNPFAFKAGGVDPQFFFQLSYPDYLQGHISGGTPPIALGGGIYGCFVHASYVVPGGADNEALGLPRTAIAQEYVHMWLEFHPIKYTYTVSRPFYFIGGGVEFASGLVLEDEGTVVVTFGYQDAEAYAAAVSLAELRALPLLYPHADAGPHAHRDLGHKFDL